LIKIAEVFAYIAMFHVFQPRACIDSHKTDINRKSNVKIYQFFKL